MSALHFHNARLIDPEAGTDAPGDLLVIAGMIADRGGRIAPPEGAQRIDCGGHVLAPGLIDLRVFVGEPGARHKESFRSAGEAAVAGGVTTICTQPDTDPVVDDPATLGFVLGRAEACAARVAPMAALTRGREGRNMAEYGFLRDAGAVAFTDAGRGVADPVVLRRCLSYAAALDALVVHDVQEPRLSALGCATETLFASWKGLPTVPAAAEVMGLERDLRLVALTGGRYHAAQLSTAAALEPLARARDAGLKVSAAVAAPHLALNEYDIGDFLTHAKLDPPLREEDDRAAMEEALASGLIDCLVSSHRPQDEESKRLPFDQAADGSVGLETLLSLGLNLHHKGLMDLATLWSRMALAPARLIGSPAGRLTPGAPADLVLIDIDAPWVVDRKLLRSKSKNSAFHGRRMQGRVLGTWIDGSPIFAPS